MNWITCPACRRTQAVPAGVGLFNCTGCGRLSALTPAGPVLMTDAEPAEAEPVLEAVAVPTPQPARSEPSHKRYSQGWAAGVALLPANLPANAATLGEPTDSAERDPSAGTNRSIFRIAVVTLFLAAAIAAVPALVTIVSAIAERRYTSWGLGGRGQPTIDSPIITLPCCSLVLLGAAIIVALGAWENRVRNPATRIWLCPGGVIWAVGGTVRAVGWREFRSVRLSMTRVILKQDAIVMSYKVGERMEFCLELTAPDGQVAKLDQRNPSALEFSQEVLARITKATLPVQRAALRAGEAVRFGPFTLRPDGLQMRGDVVPWRGVSDVLCEQGMIRVLVKGRSKLWAQTPFAEMSHAYVLLALCEELMDEANARGGR